jgi:hypothetical protein
MANQFDVESGGKAMGLISIAGIAIKGFLDRNSVAKRMDRLEDKLDNTTEKVDNLDGYIRGKLGD